MNPVRLGIPWSTTEIPVWETSATARIRQGHARARVSPAPATTAGQLYAAILGGARPHRLAVQVTALSRPRRGFESRWGHRSLPAWRQVRRGHQHAHFDARARREVPTVVLDPRG